jgi:hypothetical protein
MNDDIVMRHPKNDTAETNTTYKMPTTRKNKRGAFPTLNFTFIFAQTLKTNKLN